MSKRVLRDEWSIQLLQPPGFEPLTLAQARDACRLPQSQTFFDQQLTEFIQEARDDLQNSYGIAIIKQQVRIKVRTFPASDTIRLPIWPIQSIDAMHYYDSNGIERTLVVGDVSEQPVPDVLASLAKKPCELRLPFGKVWPGIVTQVADSIQIDATVGFISGQSPELLPLPYNVVRAMKFMVAHYFQNPEAVTVIGRPSAELVFGVERAMENIKLVY